MDPKIQTTEVRKLQISITGENCFCCKTPRILLIVVCTTVLFRDPGHCQNTGPRRLAEAHNIISPRIIPPPRTLGMTEDKKMAQKHIYEQWAWINEWQQPPFVVKPPLFQTSRYCAAKTLKSTHYNSIRNVIQATIYAKSHMVRSTMEWDCAIRKSKVTSSWWDELQMFAYLYLKYVSVLCGRKPCPAFALWPGWSLKWTCQEAVRLYQSQQSGANLALIAVVLWLQPNDKTWPESLENTC